jgi:[acyl-carrier-protein] S-malonyltransferase
MKIAFIFPGQGSQSVGMGKEFYDSFDEIKRIYDEASEVLGYDIASLIFEGPSEELNKTFRTQPALVVTSFSAYKLLEKKGIRPDAVAGHSLGEYSALVVAGSISFKDALRITEIRGKIMQDAVPEGMGLMTAILGLDRNIVDEICIESKSVGYVSAANYNCPGQIVLSGERNAVEHAIRLSLERGAKKAVPLSVSVPSHCALMEKASTEFEKVLKEIEINDAYIPFVNNIEARFIRDSKDIRRSLIFQLSRPVLWEDCVKTIFSSDINNFVEVGPGRVLSGLVKRIVPDANIFNVEDKQSLDKTLSRITG